MLRTAILTSIAAAIPGAAPTQPTIPRPAATVINAPCPTGTGSACAYREHGIIYAPAWESRFAVEHEHGHLYDHQRLDDGERAKLRRLLGLNGPWRTDTGLDGLNSPAEWFADAYAACRLRMDPDKNWEVAYGWQPTRRQYNQVCRTIARAADLEHRPHE